MTRKEVLEAYDVDHRGMIRSPGKFEAEMLYAPHFWNVTMDGTAETLSWSDGSPDIYLVEVDAADRAEFPEIPADAKYAAMSENDSGFVDCTVLDQDQYDRLIAENESDDEDFSDEDHCEGDDKPKYYECGICGAMHSAEWNGDCREDDARFTSDELDTEHGPNGWNEVPMPGTEDERLVP